MYKYLIVKVERKKLIGDIMSNSLKYGVSVTIITQEISADGQYTKRQIPKITLHSKRYFEQLLETVHDYLQMKLIEEYVPRSLQTPRLYLPYIHVLNPFHKHTQRQSVYYFHL